MRLDPRVPATVRPAVRAAYRFARLARAHADHADGFGRFAAMPAIGAAHAAAVAAGDAEARAVRGDQAGCEALVRTARACAREARGYAGTAHRDAGRRATPAMYRAGV